MVSYVYIGVNDLVSRGNQPEPVAAWSSIEYLEIRYEGGNGFSSSISLCWTRFQDRIAKEFQENVKFSARGALVVSAGEECSKEPNEGSIPLPIATIPVSSEPYLRGYV